MIGHYILSILISVNRGEADKGEGEPMINRFDGPDLVRSQAWIEKTAD